MKKFLLFSVMFCCLILLITACGKEEPQTKSEEGTLSEVVKQESQKAPVEETMQGLEEKAEEAGKDLGTLMEKAEKAGKSGVEKSEEAYEEAEEKFGIE